MPEYQAPNQETPTGRLLLVFAITFVILLLFQPLLKKYLPQQQPPPAKTEQQAQQPAPPAPTPTPEATVVPAKVKGATVSTTPTKAATAESETVIESDLYKVTFTNRGAQVKSWILKKFNDDKGQPLDLVQQTAAQQYGYPLSLYIYDQNLGKIANSALYQLDREGNKLTFEYADGGVDVRKVISFDESYVAKVEIQVTQNGNAVQAFPSWPSGFGDQTDGPSYASARIDYHPLHPGKKWWGGTKDVERLPVKEISGGNTIHNTFYWAGVTDQYFSAIFLPDDPQNAVAVTLHNPIKIPKDLNHPDPNQQITVDVLGAAVGHTTGRTSLRLFAGPKNMEVLKSIHATPVAGLEETPNLTTLVDLGTFSIIARPLFAWLRWTHDHLVANWGWSIVILTICINLALLPLRLSSMKSALKTAKIQPQMQSIRDKYKKYDMRDPRRAEMNQEIAALMKEHGVNPAGGCLPLLVQFPFLIAFYTMLGNTTELRHAPWFYIRDLSGPDPFYILPILIVITTFLVQRMTPQGGMDPQQQKMMNLMMPLMLGFISYRLSSGLCLYWVVGNLVAMLMQMALNRTELGREQRAIAAKRAAKKLGK
ncbi:MAG TPA: membrane protein insertase YidC [Terriglobales bacterium]|nr:membrane protein insertase YidC [Terriglobales bacterium]